MNTAKDLYKYLRIKSNLFKGAHDIYTPQPLVEEICNKLDLNVSSILVLFNIEFVISLVYTFNIDPSKITIYADHENKIKLAKRIGVKYITSLETDMKFDVVLANPPYDAIMEGNDQTKKVWIYFIHTSLNLLKEHGSLGFICPPSWILSNDAKLKNIRNKILELNLQVLKLGIQDQFPSNPGVQIAYFILVNDLYIGQTQFYNNENTPVTIDVRAGLPQTPDEQIKEDLINKIHTASATRFKFILNDKKGKDLSAAGQLKLIVNYSKAFFSIKNIIDNNMPITIDPVNNKQGYIILLSEDEGKFYKSFLHSKAIIWFANNYKRRGQTGFCDAVKRCAIPRFDTKLWTDPEVYIALKLTDDEIKYIETNS